MRSTALPASRGASESDWKEVSTSVFSRIASSWPEHLCPSGFQIADAEHRALPLSDEIVRRLPEFPEIRAGSASPHGICPPVAMHLTQSLRQITARVQEGSRTIRRDAADVPLRLRRMGIPARRSLVQLKSSRIQSHLGQECPRTMNEMRQELSSMEIGVRFHRREEAVANQRRGNRTLACGG